MSFPQDGLVTIFNGSRLERARITHVDQEVPVVASVEWNGIDGLQNRDVIYAADESHYWACGHGDDIEAALLLVQSARQD